MNRDLTKGANLRRAANYANNKTLKGRGDLWWTAEHC